ncbi:histidine kinase [Actinoplanes sp. NPDC026619]|uniref:sensor histidine kinase n=1 Tax=Actinoplanes sp. NPDC026619 TaxID=3155798 RepID=UPI0033EF5AD9
MPDLRRRARSHPQLTDAGLGLLVVTAVLLAHRFGPADRYAHSLGVEDMVIGVLAVLLIAARRRWPLPVFGAVTVATAAFNLHAALAGPLLAASVICTYTVASRTSRTIATAAGAVTVVTVYVAVVIGAGRSWTDPLNASIVAWGVVAVAVGEAVRSRRAQLRVVEERARQAEHGLAEEARRQVVEERLRIARDLHDVVAHHIAVINVQVGVAGHLLRDQPDRAEEALAHVRRSARTVLSELGTVLDVLRGPGDTAPPPGLSRLPQLLDSLAAAGLRVDYRSEGEPRPLPSAVDLAAYRIVQEALTNAHKHGSGDAARLHVAYTADALEVRVVNAVGPAASGTGHGLIGLRERVSSVGGTVRTGPDAGGTFTVDACLPSVREPA